MKTYTNNIPGEEPSTLHLFITINYLLTYLITYFMKQSTSWELNWFSARQISRNLWNPNFHYRILKYPQILPILSQLDPVYVPHRTS